MNASSRLPVLDSIKMAWAKVSGSKGTFFAVLCLYAILEGANQLINHFLFIKDNADQEISNGMMAVQIIAILLFLGIAIVQGLVRFGLVYLGIRRAIDQPIMFNLIKYTFDWRLFFRMIGVYILIGILMLIAAIPMFIPMVIQYFASIEISGIFRLFAAICNIVSVILMVYFIFRTFLAQSICIDQKTGPIDSLRLSFAATKSNVWRLLGLSILNGIIFIVSVIPLGIGLIWSIPYLFINLGIVYKWLVLDRNLHK